MSTTADAINWSDLLDLHVVKRLGQIVERRLRVQIGFCDVANPDCD